MTAPRPRILFAVHDAHRAGAQLIALHQAHSLAEAFELVITVRNGPLRPEFAMTGKMLDRGGVLLPIWGDSRARWALALVRTGLDAVRLALAVRRHRVDAVITNSAVLASPVLAAWLARVPALVQANEAPKSVAARRIFAFHGAVADVVVAPSRWLADAFARSRRARVVLIPSGVPLPRRETVPQSFASPVRLAVVGTIDRHKRQDLAVDVVAALRRRGVESVVRFYGGEQDTTFAGELRQRASDLGVEDAIAFCGTVAPIARALDETDILLLPAGEVLPVILQEALAYETPVVAADMGSVSDIVIDGRTGLLVRRDDADAMADAVERFVRDEAFARRAARQGREHVEASFAPELLHARLIAEISALLDPGGTVGAMRLQAKLRPSDGATRIFHSIEHELGPYRHLFTGRVLNAGAGDRDLSALVDGELVNQDIPHGEHPGHIDIWAPLEAIPVEDETFDAVICNAVLEHVEDPEAVVAELARVLTRGGHLYLGAPFLQPEHNDPRDGQRYTLDGLRAICERHGLEVTEGGVVHSVETTLAWIVYEWLREEDRLPVLLAGRFAYEWLSRRAAGSARQVHAVASSYRVIARRT